jgi:hypothetical protein
VRRAGADAIDQVLMEARGATTRQWGHCECSGCRENRQIEVPVPDVRARDRRSAHAAPAVTTYDRARRFEG